MAAAEIDRSLPDFGRGVPAAEIPDDGVLAGRVGDTPVLLARVEGELVAVSGACTHYGAALADGLRSGDTIRCPLHHACFSLRTGTALAAPAFRALERYRVERRGELVFVGDPLPAAEAPLKAPSAAAIDSIAIVGAGAAGYACAVTLRRLGYDGRVVLLGRELEGPYDRPNLSKDFLAGTAPAEWMPLAQTDFYREQEIELRLGAEVKAIDPAGRRLLLSSGESLGFDRVLLAPGAEPIRLGHLNGAAVHTLRSFDDARALAAASESASRVLIVGSGFIALEAAAALRARNIAVEIVTLEAVPFERLLGPEIGRWLQGLHERHDVIFHTRRTVARFERGRALLDDGSEIAADLVLVAIGVRPRLDLARATGLAVGDGILVDERLETSVRGIFAAGDAASYEAPGSRRRIEHWVTAQRQGETAAANMLSLGRRFRHVPFFWTEQYGAALRFVGHAPGWAQVSIDGSLSEGCFTARYFDPAGSLLASASVGRDADNLRDEALLERELESRSQRGEPIAAAAI